jgi:hypothetical protein
MLVQIIIPRGREGPEEKKQFLNEYIGKNVLKMKNLANFNQTWYKPFLLERNSSLFK